MSGQRVDILLRIPVPDGVLLVLGCAVDEGDVEGGLDTAAVDELAVKAGDFGGGGCEEGVESGGDFTGWNGDVEEFNFPGQ